MTVTAPAYTAVIVGTPNISVALREDGEIILDAGRAPHVQADVVLAVPAAMMLDDLDPRDSRRMILTMADRTFNLGIREVEPDRAEGTVAVSLASDEAILGDHAPLTDDHTPRTHETSLRDVTNYVLGTIGASLEPGSTDADVTAYWRVTNLLPNPSFETGLDGWAAGAGSVNLRRSSAATPVAGAWAALWDTTGAGPSWLDGPYFRVTPGRPMTFSAYVIASAARPARVRMAFQDAAGHTIRDLYSEPVTLGTVTWTRLSLVGAIVPPGATRGVVLVEYQSDAAGRGVFADCMMVHEGDELVPYIDGSLPDGDGYSFEWSGDAHDSTSTRLPDVERPPESLIWPAGVSGLQFLHPLVQSAGFRLVCDEQRRWTLRDASYRADGTVTARHGANIIEATELLSRDSEDWYDAAVYRYTWRDRDGIEQQHDDTFALPSPTRVKLVEVAAPYPGPGRAEYAVQRAQGRGREVEITKQATWDEHAEQSFSAILEGTPIQTGITSRVLFDLADNTVTVTSRTVDTPTPAWVLIPDGEAWTDSPLGESWTEEII